MNIPIIGQGRPQSAPPRFPIIQRKTPEGFNRPRLREEGIGDYGNIRARKQDTNNAIAKAMWTCLQFHYPGHAWMAIANIEQGVAYVQLLAFSDWGYLIKLKDMASDPGLRCVVKGGGELLERFRLGRSGFDLADYMTAQKKYRPEYTRRLKPPG